MTKILVIGYGNTLRGDDGAGVRAVESIANNHHDVDCLTCTELTPDLAETLSSYDEVFFVDASVGAVDVEWRSVLPPVEYDVLRSHALTPEILLGLVIELYDRCPGRITLVEIPARQFHYSEKLSPFARRMVLKCVAEFANRIDPVNPSVARFNTEAESDQSPATTLQFLPTDSLPS
jgi:hydrogenase maturation protease